MVSREPGHVAVIDGEEMLVDGRNRLAACKIVGVEPTTRHLNGEDPTDFVFSQNITRRHLAKGERAILTAMMYPQPEKAHRGKKTENTGKLLENKTFSGAMLSQARTVLRYLPETAKAVLAGKPLGEAYEEALAVKASNESEGAKIERLKADAPDLASSSSTSPPPRAVSHRPRAAGRLVSAFHFTSKVLVVGL